MKRTFLLLAVFLLMTGCSKEPDEVREASKSVVKPTPPKKHLLSELESEYAAIDTVVYLEHYIEHVILHGSEGLGFAAGKMQSGFADAQDAQKIAHFVVTLSGKKCSDHKMASKAQMYYTSNCGGCHGDDGKGLGGTFPDLTKPTLLGIEKRKLFLKSEIAKLKGL